MKYHRDIKNVGSVIIPVSQNGHGRKTFTLQHLSEKAKIQKTYLSKSSDHPLSKQNHINWRLKAIEQIEKTNVPNLIKKNNSNNKGSLKGNKTANIENYYFSATVCVDQESFDKLKEDIKKLIVS